MKLTETEKNRMRDLHYKHSVVKENINEQVEMEITESFRDISNTLKKVRDNQVILNLDLTDTLRDITTIINDQLHNNNMVIATWHEEELTQQ